MTTLLLLASSLFAHASVAEVVEETSSLRGQRMMTWAPSVSQTVYAKAADGKTVTGIEFVDGVKAGKGWGVAVIDAPVWAVWMAVNDVEAYAGRFSNVSHSTVISGTPRATDRRLFQYMPLPIVTDRWWVVDQSHNSSLYTASDSKMWEVYSESASSPALSGTVADAASGGMSVAWVRSGWLLTDLGDGTTLAEYATWSDPGGRLPAGPTSRFAAGAIKSLIKDMTAYAKELEYRDRAGFVGPDQQPL